MLASFAVAEFAFSPRRAEKLAVRSPQPGVATSFLELNITKSKNATRLKRWSKPAAAPVGVVAIDAKMLSPMHATVQATTWNEGNTIKAGHVEYRQCHQRKSGLGGCQHLRPDAEHPRNDRDTEVSYRFTPVMSFGEVLMKQTTARDSNGNS
ncbi:hypothetical protein [Streptomyces sp. HUAS TT7]|uniref:hypothetical protein n=1 Tax=Streptomyces sp. HUAS TT7 TaxID=3447507 RepID=UPI003F66042D